MSLEGIIVGLLAIGIGLAWAFYGLKLFAILLPLWAFIFGLTAGAQWAQDVFGEPGVFGTTLSWGIGIVFGLVLAVISYLWYYAAIVLLAGAVGYALAVGLFVALGTGTGIIVVVIGLIVGAVFAIGAFMLGVPILLVMVFSALSGAVAAVNGVFILFGQIKVSELGGGLFGSLFHNGIVATVAFIVLAVLALMYQIRDVGSSIQTVDRSSYRY
jgi:hypothetical protein